MKAKLIVEGREFPIEIQDPELQKLLTPQKTGYEPVGAGQKYWLQDVRGRVCWDTEPIHFTEYNEDLLPLRQKWRQSLLLIIFKTF